MRVVVEHMILAHSAKILLAACRKVSNNIIQIELNKPHVQWLTESFVAALRRSLSFLDRRASAFAGFECTVCEYICSGIVFMSSTHESHQ